MYMTVPREVLKTFCVCVCKWGLALPPQLHPTQSSSQDILFSPPP